MAKSKRNVTFMIGDSRFRDDFNLHNKTICSINKKVKKSKIYKPTVKPTIKTVNPRIILEPKMPLQDEPVYLQFELIFSKGILQSIRPIFYNKRGIKVYVSNLNTAVLPSKPPKSDIPLTEIKSYIKIILIKLPKNEWYSSKNKLEVIQKYYNKEIFYHPSLIRFCKRK